MSEIEIDLTDGAEESVTIHIRLYDTGDGIDVFEVKHLDDLHYFEADENCDALDVIALAVETIREDLKL